MNEEKEIEPRYMTQGKKQYYLASVDENMTQLLRGEIEGLTKVLIELKSQYDNLTREDNIKKRETHELTKKINALKDIDKKAQKQIVIAEQEKDDIEGSIQQKKITLREAQFQKKTLSNEINKLNQDILLTQKQILVSENKTKRLNKHYERERFKENQLKETKNKIYSKITEQNTKNDFEKNEQNLQLQYYKTIIQQKNMFLKSADERKERQKKIAEEAKNDSADKQEVEKRKQLGL
jgi:chromosome segregation ATPase